MLLNGEHNAARTLLVDILQEPMPAESGLAAIRDGKPAISRDDEGMYLHLADLQYEASEEVASGFIVDASPDHRVTGLEILWSESERAGCSEEPALAFGLFCAALAGLSWQYDTYSNDPEWDAVADICQRLEWMINVTGLDLRVSRETPVAADNGALLLDMAILDGAGSPLICAEIKRGKFQREIVQRYTNLLRDTAIPLYPGAIGIGVFIDETGQGNRNHPVEPGAWVDWYDAVVPVGKVWAHNTIIPPSGCNYSWLPRELRDPILKAAN